MNFIIFDGPLGSGKTNGAVMFAHYLKAKSPKTVLYSNFGVKDSKPFTTLHDFIDMTDNFSSIVILDEAHIDLDSRSFSSNHVKFLTQTSFYLRKLRCTLIMTSPLFKNLDSRIRGISNMLVEVSKDDRYFYYDMFDVSAEKYLTTKKISQEKSFSLNLYDTYSIVSPIQVPANANEFKLFLDELRIKTDQYYETEKRKDIAL